MTVRRRKEDQQFQRICETYFDQFDRPWDVNLDKDTFKYCSPPIPLWRAEHPCLTPPLIYVGHGKRIGQLYVDIDRWIADVNQRNEEYETYLRALIEQEYPAEIGEKVVNPPAHLLVRAGRRAIPRQILLAMKAENAWALGRSFSRPRNAPWWSAEIEAYLNATAFTGGAVSDADLDLYREVAQEPEEEPPVTRGRGQSARQAPKAFEYSQAEG